MYRCIDVDIQIHIHTQRQTARLMGTLKKSFSSGTTWVSSKRQKWCPDDWIHPQTDRHRGPGFQLRRVTSGCEWVLLMKNCGEHCSSFTSKNFSRSPLARDAIEIPVLSAGRFECEFNYPASFLPFWRDSSGTTGDAFFQGSHKTRRHTHICICVPLNQPWSKSRYPRRRTR